MTFLEFRALLNARIKELSEKGKLFVVDKSGLWDEYLNSFENDPIYLTNTTHNCNCCKTWIRNYANIVAIVNGKRESIWDIEAKAPYDSVTKQLFEVTNALPIKNIFSIKEVLGQASNVCSAPYKSILLEDGSYQSTTEPNPKYGKTFNHFYYDFSAFVSYKADTLKSEAKATYDVMKRSLEEITPSAIDSVLELIADKNLYKGEEYKGLLEQFKSLQRKYIISNDKNVFIWDNLHRKNAIRNTVIGTLLVEISDGEDLQDAVKSFEKRVAPENYKRSKSIYTKAQKEAAVKKLTEMGLVESLERRHATIHDLDINNVLWTNPDTKKLMSSPFDILPDSTKPKTGKFQNVEEVNIEYFMENILPSANSVEVFMENKHENNLFTLITGKMPSLFQWNNPFSWSYNKGLTDASRMAQMVISKGGRTDVPFRFTHSWNRLEPNNSLMDLHVFMPECTVIRWGKGPGCTGRRVGWNMRKDRLSGGSQDVDYTSAAPKGYVPVENIVFPDLSKMPKGDYECYIHNWNFRGEGGKGECEVAINNEVYQYVYPRTKFDDRIHVATVTWDGNELSIKHHLKCSSAPKTVWGIETQQFVEVSSIFLSPNHWENPTGNKHYFFNIEGCKAEGYVRGFYNEFLHNDFRADRKVFEALSDRMKVPYSNQQVSGLGFSSTNDASIQVRVNKGRIFKLNFNTNEQVVNSIGQKVKV